MVDFTVTDEIISKIVQLYQKRNYDIYDEQVRAIRGINEKFSRGLKSQYLAHIVREMEVRLRKIPGNEMFQIILSPVDKSFKILKFINAYYYKNRYFAINYHPNLDEKQLRIMIAHELGHLYLVDLLKSTPALKKALGNDALVEALSTIFAIFSIFDKNDFYHNRTGKYKHKTPEAILEDFDFLIK